MKHFKTIVALVVVFLFVPVLSAKDAPLDREVLDPGFYDRNSEDVAKDLLSKFDGLKKHSRFMSRIGAAYLKAGEREKAESFFAKALKDDNEDGSTWLYIGLAYMDADMTVKAEEAFAKVIKLDKNDWDNYIQIGIAYHKKGNKDKAHSYFAKGFSKEQSAGSALKLIDYMLEISR